MYKIEIYSVVNIMKPEIFVKENSSSMTANFQVAKYMSQKMALISSF